VAGEADPPEPLAIAHGRLTEVRPADHTLTVHTRDGRDLVLHADDTSVIRWHREKVGLADLHVGARVRVWYHPGNQHLVRLNPPLTLDDVKNDLDEQIGDLKEKARAGSSEAKARYGRELEELARKRDALQS